MPAMLAARLYRVLPLLAILAINRYRRLYIHVVAIHAGARQRGSHKIFIALNGGLSILFALATLYAWIEKQRIRGRFLHYLLGNHAHHARHYVHLPQEFPQLHNPNYRWRLTDRAKKAPGNRKPVKRYEHITGFEQIRQASMNPR